MHARTTVNADQLNTALVNRYIKDVSAEPTLDTEGVLALLKEIPRESLVGNASLAVAVTAHAPSAVLPDREQAIIASIDDCLKMILSLTDLELEIEQQIRFTIPDLARKIIAQPELAVSKEPHILLCMDHFVSGFVGWSANLGKAGEKLYEKLTTSVAAVLADEDVEAIEQDLRAFFDKEQGRIIKLEDRLAASESGRLRSQQSKAIAAEMINGATKGKQLTSNIVEFLHGPWYDSAQLLVLTEGMESEDWSRMKALTETIVWTYQPIESEDEAEIQKEKQRLYRIIEFLPGEIRDLLVALQHNVDAGASALESLESDHVAIVSGQTPDYSPFDQIENDDQAGTRPTVSRLLLKKLANFEPGQWFLYKSEEVEVRIKLLIKLNDVKQLLFTNRNGMKVMQRSFEEFAYYLSSGVARPLNSDAVFSNTFRTFYEGLIEEHARQQKRIAERKAERSREEDEREEARQRAQREAADLARKQEEEVREAQALAREERLEAASKALETADKATVDAITKRVSELSVGAWLKLPGPDGQLEECKLAVKISATDKLIFVSQAGTKIGDYTTDELMRLLVAGQGEIQDGGVEFEDTLQQVVSRLRQDRNKSYDDLTGE